MQQPTIPQVWVDVLKHIQVYFPEAVIAGGAIRDLWNNKPIKDIDVFIPVQEAEDNLWADQIESIDPYYRRICTNVYGQEGNQALPGFRTLHAVYRIIHPDCEQPFEFIFIKSKANRVSNEFDINICQAEFDGENLYTTNAFDEGIETKTIWVTTINRADRQSARLKRMTDKYPEFKLRNGDGS